MLAEVAVKATIGIIVGDARTATLALCELVFPAVVTHVHAFVLMRLLEWDSLSAKFANYWFHNYLI